MHYSGSPDDSEKKPRVLWLNALFLVLTPLAALILTPLYILEHGVHWAEPVAMVVLWYLTGMGITAGYHRMFSHRAWWAPAPIRAILLVLGAAAWQNSAIAWSAAHRYHHRHVDTEDDPYSIQEGFWWAHMLWVMVEGKKHQDFESAPDLRDDPLCQWQHNNYFWISTLFNIGVPLLLGLMTGRLFGMLLWAGLVRVVVVHHFTFFINSLAHMWGSRPWSKEQSARDNAVLAFFTFGEGYHNFHHTFPGDYRNGFRWYQFDPTKWTIALLNKVGLAQDLRRTTMDRRLKKRWQTMRERYETQMDEWNESMREQIQAAEASLEEALTEMRSKRAEWARKAEELQAQARDELERARIEAERRALEAFRNWQSLVPAQAR
ncbi:acyl-CoA desaturase [Persicimonas caeni]|uniref:Acyl-CoA desaturase n=1 Tax=Persicimonas caeni TaxID=2292766 RepID=A0A4Y6PXX5_PERCE|nr:fatty acid desaturase [Persicimonas caeni]QDG52999.1 acyl-CoA desaturase [Persicimonas caeni]QED34221.1 acyl-CoA desaturase [Persicimonas caeni]